MVNFKISPRIKLLLTIILSASLTAFILTLLLIYTLNYKLDEPGETSQAQLKTQTLSKKHQTKSIKKTGRLEGKVLDRSGNPLLSQITLHYAKTGTTIAKSETNENGDFAFHQIPSGDYYLRAVKENQFSEFVPLHVFPDNTTTQNIYLDLQTTPETAKK